MRLLIVHNEYAAKSGEEHALQAIAGLLEENGHEVTWFQRSSADIKGVFGKVSAFFSGVHSPGAVKDLRGFLHRHAFDAALVQNLYPLLSPSIIPILKEFSIPVVMRCPNYRLFCPNGLHLSHGEVCERCLGGREYWCILRNCEKSLLKSTGYAARNAAARLTGRITDTVDRFIVLTSFQKGRFSECGIPSEKMAVLPNIAPELQAPDFDHPGDQVTYVGRISPEKGIEDFLTAAARLPDIPFSVAGDHSAMPHLPPKSPKNVRWMGFLSGKALDDLYRQSRVLVFPGKWFEGFPNVIARAMAAGKPVIASDLGAAPEIVEHNHCGLLFKPGDTAELTTRILQLYGDPDTCRTMGAAGRLKAETQYSRRVVYDQLMRILTDARRQ